MKINIDGTFWIFLFAALLFIKIFYLNDISWWVVTLPITIPISTLLILTLVVGILTIIQNYTKNDKSR